MKSNGAENAKGYGEVFYKRNRLAALLLALALIITLAAVSAAASEDAAEDEEDAGFICGEEYYGRFRGGNIAINVYNWGEYISDGSDDSMDINREFTNLTGVRINYTNYATNEELYSKLRSGYSSYDVIIPSDYMAGRLINEGMLIPLDYSNIPNIEFIDDRFMSPIYDPGGRYSAPYTWGYVGIIYNRNMIFDEEEVGTWNIFWDEKYLGKMLMFSNSRDAFAIAQLKLGYSMNSDDERELYDCLDQLKLQKPLVQAYVMDEIFDKMLGGEAAIAPYYAGDALMMMAENEDLDFIVPDEGTNLFVDVMCIPRGSGQKEAAEMYINFMLEPAVGAANSEYIGYATPNLAALELLDEELRNDPIAYPDVTSCGRPENFIPLPQETSRLMDRLWTELLSDDDTYNRMLMPLLLLAAAAFSVGLNVYRVQIKRRAHING
jgi:spermidine/putrescine transport system substrate-binding protein